MSIKLSQSALESFSGNIVPLRLLGVAEYGMEDITWSSSDPCVHVHSFEKEAFLPFTDGVLLTLLKEGTSSVTAKHKGVEYTCRVTVRKAVHTESQKGLSYFVGDFHNHTQRTHDKNVFALREEEIPFDFMTTVKNEGVLDFTVISDHACLLGGREYFRGFWDAHVIGEEGYIAIPGSEAQATPKFEDRYGITHAEGGEIVTVNAVGCYSGFSWEEFFDRYKTSPFAICILAHPQVSGWSTPGIWGFRLNKNNSPRFKEMVKGIEMGNGSARHSNIINEYVLSSALDNGFFASTTCATDNHKREWSVDKFPGRTVIMATEKSKEAFLDAIHSRRFYATESGNVKLYYEVNGLSAPCTLPEADEYRFHVELGLFFQRDGDMPTNLKVVSDYGKTVFETNDIKSEMDFTVKSTTARYFYLRFMDEGGRKTWSVPVLTGRTIDGERNVSYSLVDKKGFTAIDEESGEDASVLFNDDPNLSFFAKKPTSSILLDMNKVTSIAALGHYPTILRNKEIIEAGFKREDKICEFPLLYRVETGLTKDDMKVVAEGCFRIFGEEELIEFEAHEARFVRFRVLSTAGRESGWPQYRNALPTMAELTLYSK